MLFKNKLIQFFVISAIFVTICSAPVVPSEVTAQEIQLREKQIEIANQLVQSYKAERNAGMGSLRDMLIAEDSRIDCEIKLPQARQLFESKQVNKSKS